MYYGTLVQVTGFRSHLTLTFDLESYYHTFPVFTARRKASFASSAIFYGIPVCPPHSGIVSKRENAEGCGLHHQVAQCLVY